VRVTSTPTRPAIVGLSNDKLLMLPQSSFVTGAPTRVSITYLVGVAGAPSCGRTFGSADRKDIATPTLQIGREISMIEQMKTIRRPPNR
jgi:hypothetical protein